MGFIGDLWSIPNTFISAGLASSASRDAYMNQRGLMKLQAQLNYDYGQRSLRESPSAQREGLMTAGYNPMLAVQNATSGANSGWTSGTGVNQADIAGITSANATAAQAFNSMDNLDKQTESNVKFQDAQARKLDAETTSFNIHNKYLDKNEKAQLGKLDAETSKLNRETSYFDALEQNMLQERKLQELGIYSDVYARKYAADKGYAGTVYNANTNERNNILTNKVNSNRVNIGFGGFSYDKQKGLLFSKYHN